MHKPILPSARNRKRGQSMVEFALAFPIFLLIVIGIMEFGRLFITYTSVYAAAREGARYGAAVENLCKLDEITAQANRVAFVTDGLSVNTVYSKTECGQLRAGDQVTVTASIEHFRFITGLIPVGGDGSIKLESTAKRTIIKQVYLGWTLSPADSTVLPTHPGTTEIPTATSTHGPKPTNTPTPVGTPTNTPTITPTKAGVCVGSMEIIEQPSTSVVVVRISNDLEIVLKLEYIKITWSANDRYLDQIGYVSANGGDEDIIWDGAVSSSPFYYTFPEPLAIYHGISTFNLYFTKNNAQVTDVEMIFQAASGETCEIVNTP